MKGIDWSYGPEPPPGGKRMLLLAFHTQGGLRSLVGASMWTELYAFTELPRSATLRALLRGQTEAERERYGACRCCACVLLVRRQGA